MIDDGHGRSNCCVPCLQVLMENLEKVRLIFSKNWFFDPKVFLSDSKGQVNDKDSFLLIGSDGFSPILNYAIPAQM